MSPFKPGDRVRCRESWNAPLLTTGDVYTVEAVKSAGGSEWVTLEGVHNKIGTHGYGRFRFSKVHKVPAKPRPSMGWVDEGLSKHTDAIKAAFDDVTNPGHYNWIPGIECKDVVKHFPFMRGAAIKYLWRAGRKGDKAKHLQDLRKAVECITNEIKDLENTKND